MNQELFMNDFSNARTNDHKGLIGERDLYLLGEGTHWRPYHVLGAHPYVLDGVEGVNFAVWAPNAKEVSVIGDFNGWD
ncbi:MAG: hypothetical protein IJK97_01540, partial [Thermoguttaceae bacterium]|nr:hypothetical protein [Thermoguttaceae bacterium]